MSPDSLSTTATLGAASSGGCVAGALMGAGEDRWLRAISAVSVAPGAAGYAMALYGLAGLVGGLAVGAGIILVRRWFGRAGATRGSVFTVTAGLMLVFAGYPLAKHLLARDVFMQRMQWGSPEGLMWQAMLLTGFCGLYFGLTLGASRLLDRAPDWVAGPWFAPLVVAIASTALLLVPAADADDGGAARTGEVPEGPNIVLVMADTLRADVTDPVSEPGLTPNLASLASQGVRFRNARAHSSWTRPSVATVFSGRYPSSHGSMFRMDALSDELDTIAEQLHAGGYRTHGIVTNFVTAPYFNFQQGFDDYVYLEPRHLLGADEVTSKLRLHGLLTSLHRALAPDAVHPGTQYRSGSEVTDAALRWLQGYRARASATDRYFLFVQYMDPHDPYFAHPHDGDAPSRKTVPYPAASMRHRFWSLYRGEVAYWDRQLGRLLDGLRADPGWEDTLVLVFSDHGEEFMEHGGWWHGDTLYEEVVRVPLVVRLPGDEAAGKIFSQKVGLVDVAPTLVRLGGVDVPDSYQGHDLFAGADESIFAEQQHVGNDLYSLIYESQDGPLYKVIACNADNPRDLPSRSLFDLSADPTENKNLAATHQVVLHEALGKLAQAMNGAARGAVEAKPVQMDEATQHRLHELGYVDEQPDG